MKFGGPDLDVETMYECLQLYTSLQHPRIHYGLSKLQIVYFESRQRIVVAILLVDSSNRKLVGLI